MCCHNKSVNLQQIWLSQTLVVALPSAAVQLTSSLAGLGILAFVILVHEAGHYFASRLQGIRVKSFSIGFGPAFFSFRPKNSETEFSLRVIPLGGFVSFPEETVKDEETGELKKLSDPDLLSNRPISQRALVISAGVLANIFFAWVSLFASVSIFGLPQAEFSPGAVVVNIRNTSGPASQAGLQPNDIIVRVDEELIPASSSAAKVLADDIRSSQGRVLNMEIERKQERHWIQIKPYCCNEKGEATLGGVELIPNMQVVRKPTKDWIENFQVANSEFYRFTCQIVSGLYRLFTNFRQSSSGLAGPIGVVSMGAELARNDASSLFSFAAVLSINLALINSLPIPALDGGQMMFLLVEALRGVPISWKTQEAANRAALFLFFVASGLLLIGDLQRLNWLSFLFPS
eukprot:jgi/Galph1/4274/GphlegSOOS_G2940.1